MGFSPLRELRFMQSATVRDATEADSAAILALNLEFEYYMSPMDERRLSALRSMATYLRVVDEDGAVSAFLLAFREGAAYDSPNYRWFSERYDRFLYVDRIAVSAERHGRALGSALYNDLFAFARETGVSRVTCEFYTSPPNEVSRAFHARFGFREVGTQHVYGEKIVSLQVADLSESRQAPSLR